MGFEVGNAKQSEVTFTPDFEYKTTSLSELPSNQSKRLIQNIKQGTEKHHDYQ